MSGSLTGPLGGDREGVETVEEFNLCTAQRDLGLIFMHQPGPHSPLFPVAQDQPACQSEARSRRKKSHMSARGELVRGRRQDGADTHHPQAAAAENRSAQSVITGSKLINNRPVLLIPYSQLDYIQL